MRRLFSIGLKLIGILLLAAVLLVGSVQTPPGQRLLARAIVALAERFAGVGLQIDGLSGWIPCDMRIDRLAVGDAAGVWLLVREGAVRWNLRALLDGKIDLESVEAAEICWLRSPLHREGAAAGGSGRAELPAIAVQLDRLRVGRFLIGEAVAGMALEYAVESDGIALHRDGRLTGSLAVAGDVAGRVHFDAVLPGGEGGVLTVAADLDAVLTDPSTNRYSVCGAAEVMVSNAFWSVNTESLAISCFDVVGLTLSGVVDSSHVDLRGDLAECAVGEVGVPGASDFAGTLRGVFRVSGPLDAPSVAVELEGAGLASSRLLLKELPLIDLHLLAGVSGGRFFASVRSTNSATGHLTADVEMPCALSFAPWKAGLEPEKMQGKLSAQVDFGRFNEFTLLEDQHLAGVGMAELQWEAGVPSGFVWLENGRYEHYDLGIAFHSIAVELEAVKSGLAIGHATGSDGFGGNITCSGMLSLDGYAVDVALERAKVVRSEAVDATVSGRLAIAGPLRRPEISGTLAVDRAEILLDNLATPAPPLLTNFDARMVETNAVAALVVRPFPVGLDIEVQLRDQIYVVASLIDSVWGGVLHVADTAQGISVKGKVEPRRGYVDFVGKKFRFKEGDVLLDGSVPAVPVMNHVSAEYGRSDITARLVLSGRVTNPRYRLESTPSLPEDEILSHVLFNRDTSSISPYQAYQIAAAARQLSEGVNGPGFIYQVRRAVGIDSLEWREGATPGDASSLAAGKYLTSGLYVEVNRSLDSKGDTGMVAEYELTRHLSVETSTGPQLRPGIGVNLKYDF